MAKEHPCPICHKPDWCCVLTTGGLAVCMREEGPGYIRRAKNGGNLHRLSGGDFYRGAARVRTVRAAQCPTDLSRWRLPARQFQEAVNPARLQRLAAALGVSVGSLRRLGIGWASWRNAWSFPMSDAAGHVLGTRLRSDGGEKSALKGGPEGLFIPADLSGADVLAVCEGPTDTAALLDLGLAAVGRPSCRGGLSHLVALVTARDIRSVIVFADNDAVGVNGAEDLANVLMAYAREVRVVRPPAGIKDVRAWVQGGATREVVQAAIDAAAPGKLKITSERTRPTGRRKGARHGR